MTVQLLSVAETAERLGIAVQTLRNWISQKRVPYVKLGRRTLFDPRQIERWLSQHTVREQGAPPPLEDLLARKGVERRRRKNQARPQGE